MYVTDRDPKTGAQYPDGLGSCRANKGALSCSTLIKGTRASGFVFGNVRALRARLPISRDWRKKKSATTTDDNGFWGWRISIVLSPESFPVCPTGIRLAMAWGCLLHVRSAGAHAPRSAE